MKTGSRIPSVAMAVLLVLAMLVPGAALAQPPGVLISPPQANVQVHAGAPNLLEVDATALGPNINLVEWQTVFAPPAGGLIALEIFGGIGNIVPATVDPGPQDDQTVLPLDLPLGTAAVFVVRGPVTAVDAANGEWELDVGGAPVIIYESLGSSMPVPAPVVGDTVRAVGLRTLAPGPHCDRGNAAQSAR